MAVLLDNNLYSTPLVPVLSTDIVDGFIFAAKLSVSFAALATREDHDKRTTHNGKYAATIIRSGDIFKSIEQ